MTVEEAIKELQKIKNKNIPVLIYKVTGYSEETGEWGHDTDIVIIDLETRVVIEAAE